MLTEKLASILPLSIKFSVHHFKTKPRQCRRPLIYYGDKYEDVFDYDSDIEVCSERKKHSYVTHFIVLASNADEKNNKTKGFNFPTIDHSDEASRKDEPRPTSRMILLYGIELYIFFSPDYTTVFISKADTTGQKLPGKTKISYLDITRSILEYLVASHKTNPNEKMIDKSEIPLRICLFTRPEKQYLFPLSAPPESTDGSKHLMNGTQLVEWWIKCLEPIVGKMESAKARLEMPGSETRVIDNIINNRQNWAKGVIFGESANTSGSGNEDEKAHETTDHEKVASDFSISRNKAAIYHIPRFPDDPKARFLDYMMYEEKRDLKTSLMNFWIELQGRQEFLLGAVTGIIGIEGYYRKGVESQQSVRQAEIDQKDDDLALSYKDFKNLREIVTTSDYSTRELVIDAYDELIATEPGFTRMEITGTKRDMETSKTANPVGAQSRAVNNLTGLVRRKRVNDEITGQGKDCNGSVNILTDNLIKKKAKN